MRMTTKTISMRYWYYNICLIGFISLWLLPQTGFAFQSPKDTTIQDIVHPGWANGTVVNEFSEPLAGVQVSIKNNSTKVLTDQNGHFEIDVPAGTILVFTWKDYYVKEVKAGNAVTIQLKDAFLKSPKQV